MSNKQTRWFLVSNCGMNFPLHQTMISLGKEGCDLVLQSRSVDKRHALITFDHYEKRFKVKDLNSINGTYLNEIRIPSQTFIKLEHLDTLRFGFDVTVYQIQQVVETFPVPVIPVYRLCNWKVSPYSHQPVKMADCQGCVQKQTIPHTCGGKGPELIATNQSVPEDVRILPSECMQSLPNPRNDQLCGRTPATDSCGNFFPRPGFLSSGNLTHSRPDCGAPQTPANSQQRTLTDGLTAENRNCVPKHDFASGEDYFIQHPYSLPQDQPHSTTSKPCACTFGTQKSPFELTHHSKATLLSPRVSENTRLNTSKNLPGSSNTSLQSTFSGDSLDTTLDDNAIQQKSIAETVPVTQNVRCSVVTTTENARPSNVVSESVALTEKPIDSSVILSDSASTAATGRPVCTAFTIEFDDDPHTGKKLDIKGSISKFAPQKVDCETKMGHRRNVLELFSDENGNCSGKKSNSHIEAPKLGTRETEEKEGTTSPTMRIVSAAKDKLTKSGVRMGGYHSEGHASSDQEGIDDISAKSDPERRNFKLDKDNFEIVGLPVKLAERKSDCSPKTNGTIHHRSLPAGDLRDSAKYLINKMFGEVTAPTNSPTEPISPTILSALHSEKGQAQRGGLSASKPSRPAGLQLMKGDIKGGVGSLDSGSTYALGNKMDKDLPDKSRYSSTRNGWKDEERSSKENDEQIKEMVFSDEEEDIYDQEEEEENENGLPPNERVKRADSGDNLSEAGTYTIESDQKDAKEESLARKEIDSVFGVDGKCVALKRPVVECEEEVDLNASSVGQSNVDSAQGRRSNNGLKEKSTPVWLKEWVARAALENNDITPASVSSDASISRHQLPLRGANEMVNQRQRRRLPIPPVDRLQVVLPVAPDNNAVISKTKNSFTANEKLRASSSSTSPDGRRSDSSMDTETILKETENVVSAMEARMDYKQQRSNSGEIGDTNTSVHCRDCKDSGGESDVDTSTASGANESISCGTYKKSSRQMVTNMKAQENNDHVSDRLYRKNRASRECYQGRNTPTGEFGGNYSEGETASIHSDMSSSSEVSGSSPVSGRKCTADKAPLMRFNRAFSLRRARLDCDSDATTGKRLSAVTKISATPAISRPSSAGSVGSSKEGPRRGSASNRSDSGGSAVSTGTPHASGGSFERSDGGRFSLRLPKSAPTVGRTRARPAANSQAAIVKGKGSTGGKSTPNPRSNSTLSSKELEMKNWKRRKEYDPLKAAMEGRKKDLAGAKTKTVASASTSLSKSETHSPTGTHFTRSVSFHGTDGLISLRRNTFTSEDEIVGDIPPETTTQHGYPILPTDAFGPIYDVGLKCRTKKSSEDECTSEATRAYSHLDLTSESAQISSPRGSPLLYPVHRHKSKIDALDNLVISTINQVSSNLRGKAEEILRKLSGIHRLECVQCLGAGGVADLLERLADGDSPDLSPQGSSVSRQLSAILKNMKRLEESLQAVDKVLDATNGTDDSYLEKVNCKLRNYKDGPPSSSGAKKKSSSCHVQATF